VNASALKIRGLQATPVNAPLARPHPAASGVVESAPLVLVDLETAQGLTSSSYVFCYTSIALKPITDLIDALQPLIQGDAVAPLAMVQKLQGRFLLLGPQHAGVPVARIELADPVLLMAGAFSLCKHCKVYSYLSAEYTCRSLSELHLECHLVEGRKFAPIPVSHSVQLTCNLM
jgi:mandelate racemase